MMGKLIWLMGPSGSGKDSLLAELRLREQTQLLVAHRYITRDASAGSENHIALSEQEFFTRAGQNLLALSWHANGLYYGVGVEIDLWLHAGFDVLVNGSRAHLPQARARYQSALLPVCLQDSPEMREELADYYNEISRFDDHVGQVLNLLREEGELENTFIIVMSDNGRAFQQSKTRVNMQGIKSPFIVYYPPLIKKGVVTESLASAVDIAPTLLDVAKVKRSAGLQGVSLLPVLKEPETEVREYAFAEHNWHVFKAYERAVITKEYIYIYGIGCRNCLILL